MMECTQHLHVSPNSFPVLLQNLHFSSQAPTIFQNRLLIYTSDWECIFLKFYKWIAPFEFLLLCDFQYNVLNSLKQSQYTIDQNQRPKECFMFPKVFSQCQTVPSNRDLSTLDISFGHTHGLIKLFFTITGCISFANMFLQDIALLLIFLMFPCFCNCLHVFQNNCPALLVQIYILMFKSDSAPKIQASKGNGHGKDLTWI